MRWRLIAAAVGGGSLDGWIKLYRKLLFDVVWVKSSNEQRVILVTILLLASHTQNEWEWQGKKFKVLPGQFITSADSIIKHCNNTVTRQNVRSALKKFEKYNFSNHGNNQDRNPCNHCKLG